MPVTIFAGSPNKARIGGKSKNSPHLPTLPPLSRLPRCAFRWRIKFATGRTAPDSLLPVPYSLR
ncbi:MAG: hypothetical protein F6J98_13330 [Moorea sp. SIO4G2]|uniref:hypothetical protein n=1 Tax=unclassified Moorena TaxID=2683338 RepID=UPI0013F8D726|nr:MULTISPECIES: hypothetical protein [unclassified Moorena]NEO11890.1 hypothetical protein [Moorena sp. SIO3E8]NEO61358.1 hypothetical protein [Moorena sp. SIO4G2]NEP98726.1 hypothetical protein [Moorena sp. SIO3F7]